MLCSGSAPPRFLGRAPDEYLLCFKQDRLVRIHASVRWPAPAPAVFAAACAAWWNMRRNGEAPARSRRAIRVERTGACEGREGDIRFSARLGEESTLSMVLESVPDP